MKLNNTSIFILLIFLISFCIRVIPIFYNAISFHYDMSRDAFAVREILEGNLKIQGPPTSTPGLFHGVFYYYLLAPFYLIANGDPKIAAVFMAILNSLVVFPVMLLTKEIFKSTKLMILAGFLYAIASEAAQYALWLSNPSPAMLTVSLFFYSLWLWKKGIKIGFYLSLLLVGLSAQFQLFLIYLLVIILIFMKVFKIKLSKNELFLGLGIIFLTLISFIVAAIKFQAFNQIFSGFLGITTPNQFDFRIQFSDYFLDYINRFVDIFINNFLPTNVLLGGVLALISLFIIRKDKFIFICLLSNSFLFLLGGHNSAYVNVGMITPAILSLIFLVNKFAKISLTGVAVLLTLITISNIYMITKSAKLGQQVLVIPKSMILSNQIKLIDKTYSIAQGKAFSINTITLPIWTNTTWAYLYSWYGYKKYGYTPSFYGRDQIGLPGEKELSKISRPETLAFLIIEPEVGIPASLISSEMQSENGKTKLQAEFNFNGLRLQQREPISND
jgi:hypothetical protein